MGGSDRAAAAPARYPLPARDAGVLRSHTPSNSERSGNDHPARGSPDTCSHGLPRSMVASALSCLRHRADLCQQPVNLTPDLHGQSTTLHRCPPQPHDEILTIGQPIRQPKGLPGLALDRIPRHCCRHQPLRHDDAQSGRPLAAGAAEMQFQDFAAHASAAGHYGIEFRCTQQTLQPPEVGTKLRPRGDGVPWHVAHESLPAHRGFACGRESRGCASGARPKADKCVSWLVPRIKENCELQRFLLFLSSFWTLHLWITFPRRVTIIVAFNSGKKQVEVAARPQSEQYPALNPAPR